jgi:hypothetical protein
MSASSLVRRGGLTGAMVQPGTGSVWLTTFHRPVPDGPPAELRHDVRPIRDRSGRLLDWVFHADPAGAERVAERYAAVQRWRANWADERAIGDALTVAAFVGWVEPRLDVTALPRLAKPVSHFEPQELPRLRWEADSAARMCRASKDNGVGLLQDGDRLLRGFVGGAEPLTVLSGYGAGLELTGAQLILSTDHPAARLPADEPLGPRECVISGWHDTSTGVSVRTEDGELELGQHPATRLLHMLAPNAPMVQVRPVPLARIFAYLMVSVADITSLADHARQPLLVYRNPSHLDGRQG